MKENEKHIPTTRDTTTPAIDRITGQPIDDQQLLLLIARLAIQPAPFDHTVTVNWLGCLYFDTVSPYTASRNLRKEIANYAILERALTLSGWNKRKRHFTPRQIAILFHFLGPVSAP